MNNQPQAPKKHWSEEAQEQHDRLDARRKALHLAWIFRGMAQQAVAMDLAQKKFRAEPALN